MSAFLLLIKYEENMVEEGRLDEPSNSLVGELIAGALHALVYLGQHSTKVYHCVAMW